MKYRLYLIEDLSPTGFPADHKRELLAESECFVSQLEEKMRQQHYRCQIFTNGILSHDNYKPTPVEFQGIRKEVYGY